MRKIQFLRAALCLITMMSLFGLTANVHEAAAQCQPCPTWWVEYDYIFPPCLNPVTVEVEWSDGTISHVTETTDGHKVYPTPNPNVVARAVRVNGIAVPLNGSSVWIPYSCAPGQDMCLKVEVRCNPCLEIKLHLEPCPPCTTWWVNYDYIFPPCDIPVTVDVQWSNGQWNHEVSTTDGHIIYPTPGAPATPVNIMVLGFNVPLTGQPVWIPYPCTHPPMPNMCLKAEVRANPCLEVKLHLEPCP